MTKAYWLSAFLRPFIMLVFMLGVVAVARLLLSFLPEGKLKRLLTRRVGP